MEKGKNQEINIKKSQHNVGLYIHIPFCKYICTYCDFCKKNIKYYDAKKYIDYLIQEFDKYKKYFTHIDTIYIGGGTPTSLKEDYLRRLFTYINNNIDFNNIVEYTIEGNPDDFQKEEYILFLKKNNITRISLGVQTLEDNILKKLKREHTRKDVQQAIDLISLHKVNLNIDLMFNLPDQKEEHIIKTISFIKDNISKINHISYYSLILEESTILYNQKYQNFTEDEEDYIYKFLQKNLEKIGYFQYEISNYAKPGFKSLHNLKYWQRKNYIGVGLGASSFLENKRYTNTRSYKDYLRGLDTNKTIYLDEEELTIKEGIAEVIMLGLRLTEGISKKIFEENQIPIDLKYFTIQGNKVAIKKEYLFLSNQIIINCLDKINY